MKLTKYDLTLYCNKFNYINKLVKRRNQKVRELKCFNFERRRIDEGSRERSIAHGVSKRKQIKKEGKISSRGKAHVREGVAEGSCLNVKI